MGQRGSELGVRGGEGGSRQSVLRRDGQTPPPRAGMVLTEGFSRVVCGHCRLMVRVCRGQAGAVFSLVASPGLAKSRRSVYRR